MTGFQVLIAIINIIAVIVAPIISVSIAQKLQEKAEKRKDKLQVFKILMTSRIYGWTTDSVYALNTIDIIFADDEDVIVSWRNLNDKYHTTNPDSQHLWKIQQAQYKLLETMANSLGYKDKITWETIQNPYIPDGLLIQMDNQKKAQQVYMDVMSGVCNMMPKDANPNPKDGNA